MRPEAGIEGIEQTITLASPIKAFRCPDCHRVWILMEGRRILSSDWTEQAPDAEGYGRCCRSRFGWASRTVGVEGKGERGA